MGIFHDKSEKRIPLTEAIDQQPTSELKKRARAIRASSWTIMAIILSTVVYEILCLFISVAMVAGAFIGRMFAPDKSSKATACDPGRYRTP